MAPHDLSYRTPRDWEIILGMLESMQNEPLMTQETLNIMDDVIALEEVTHMHGPFIQGIATEQIGTLPVDMFPAGMESDEDFQDQLDHAFDDLDAAIGYGEGEEATGGYDDSERYMIGENGPGAYTPHQNAQGQAQFIYFSPGTLDEENWDAPPQGVQMTDEDARHVYFVPDFPTENRPVPLLLHPVRNRHGEGVGIEELMRISFLYAHLEGEMRFTEDQNFAYWVPPSL
jgi:hypothetical protein